MKKKQTHTQIYKQESFENLLLLCSITKWNARNCFSVYKQIIPSDSWPCTFSTYYVLLLFSITKWNVRNCLFVYKQITSNFLPVPLELNFLYEI